MKKLIILITIMLVIASITLGIIIGSLAQPFASLTFPEPTNELCPKEREVFLFAECYEKNDQDSDMFQRELYKKDWLSESD